MYCPVTGEGVADDFVVDVDKGEGHVGALGEEGACGFSGHTSLERLW